MRTALFDYGSGNIIAIKNILESIGIYSIITSKVEELLDCKFIFIAGVSSFDNSIVNLKKLNFSNYICSNVLFKDKIIIGICAGMQILFNSSEEGKEEGLKLIPGKVKKFISNLDLKVPHIGWNKLIIKDETNIFYKLNNKKFYFSHSYYVDCDEKYAYAFTDYQKKFPSIVKKSNIYGFQFHPEKSNVNGKELFKILYSHYV
jgi:glutamine amidotransferase